MGTSGEDAVDETFRIERSEIVRAFAMWERAQLYDWCLCGGDYSLVAYAEKMTPLFLESFRVGE